MPCGKHGHWILLVMVKKWGQIALVRIFFNLSILLTIVPEAVKSGPHDLPVSIPGPAQQLFFHQNNDYHLESQFFNVAPQSRYPVSPHSPVTFEPEFPGFHNYYFTISPLFNRVYTESYKFSGIPPINGPPPDPADGYPGDQPFKSKANVRHADSCIQNSEVLLASAGKNPVLFASAAGSGFYFARTETVGNKSSGAPLLICPDDISTYTDINECTAFIAGELDPVFNEDEVVTLTWEMDGSIVDESPATGINRIGDYTFPEGATIVTYTATGTGGATTTCTFTVTISDNQVPRLEGLPGNITVAAEPGRCSNTVFWMQPAVSDNCTPQHLIRVVGTAAPGDEFPVGTTRVHYHAIDAMHNESQPQSFTVTIEDRQTPELTLPADVTAECGEPLPAAWTDWQQFTIAGGSATDNCGIDESSFRLLTETRSSEVCPYTLTRTYEVKDVNGNGVTAEHKVFVTGEEAPGLKSGTAAECVLDIAADLTHLTCFESNDGAIDITISGSTGTLEYTWTGPGTFTSTTEDLSSLIAGTYSVIVKDEASCEGTGSFEISEPDVLVAAESHTAVSCNGGT
ncbi:MAG: HYR domain-containing protein, partial [Mariniphaga sp.]